MPTPCERGRHLMFVQDVRIAVPHRATSQQQFDRIDRADLVHAIRDRRGSLVAVKCVEVFERQRAPRSGAPALCLRSSGRHRGYPSCRSRSLLQRFSTGDALPSLACRDIPLRQRTRSFESSKRQDTRCFPSTQRPRKSRACTATQLLGQSLLLLTASSSSRHPTGHSMSSANAANPACVASGFIDRLEMGACQRTRCAHVRPTASTASLAGVRSCSANRSTSGIAACAGGINDRGGYRNRRRPAFVTSRFLREAGSTADVPARLRMAPSLPKDCR